MMVEVQNQANDKASLNLVPTGKTARLDNDKQLK